MGLQSVWVRDKHYNREIDDFISLGLKDESLEGSRDT